MAKEKTEQLNERLVEGAREGAVTAILTDAVLGLLPGAPLVKVIKSAGKGAIQGTVMSLDDNPEKENDQAMDIPEKVGENLAGEILMKGVKAHKR